MLGLLFWDGEIVDGLAMAGTPLVPHASAGGYTMRPAHKSRASRRGRLLAGHLEERVLARQDEKTSITCNGILRFMNNIFC